MGTPVQLLPSLWDEVLGTQEQALRQPLAGLEVTGRRVHGHYPEPAWEQLEQDLRTNSRIQGARATQQAQLAVSVGLHRQDLVAPPPPALMVPGLRPLSLLPFPWGCIAPLQGSHSPGTHPTPGCSRAAPGAWPSHRDQAGPSRG